MFIKEVLNRLYPCFPGAFLNMRFEFIADYKHNIYSDFSEVENMTDVEVKLLSSLSRSCCKGIPKKTQEKMRNGLNQFLGTEFTENDYEVIYMEIGNGINKSLAYEFVNSGYDLEVIKREVSKEYLEMIYK